MRRRRLRGVITQESKSSSRQELWWRWGSNSKGWWEHRMLNSSCNLISANSTTQHIRHHNPKHLTRITLEVLVITVPKDVLKVWPADPWSEKKIYKTCETKERFNLVKRNMECSKQSFNNSLTAIQIMLIWLINFSSNFNSQNIQEFYKQSCQEVNHLITSR